MANSISTKSPLHEAVTCILSCVLQGDNRMLHKTLDRMKKIQVIEEFPVVLSELIDAHQLAKPERHLASVCLKNYFQALLNKEHKNSALFTMGYGTTILDSLFRNIDTTYPDLREIIATNIAMLMSMGFWQEGTLILNRMFVSNDEMQISNFAHILNKAIDEHYIKEEEKPMVQHWFVALLSILKMTHLRSPGRAATVRPIFVLLKFQLSNPSVLQEYLTRAVEEFEKVLHESHSENSEFGLNLEIMKFLNNSLDELAEYSNIFIPPVLPIIGIMLTACCDLFKKIVRGSQRAPKDFSEAEGEARNFFDLVGSMVDLILKLVELPYLDLLLEDLHKLIYCIYVFMSCHSGMEESLYKPTDVQKNYFWLIRDSCKSVLLRVAEKIKERQPDGIKQYFKTTHQVFQALSQELDQSPSSPYKLPYTSRLTESMVYGLGSLKEYMDLDDREFPLPLKHYMDFWTGYIEHCSPLLQGRIIWFGGLFCTRPEISGAVVDSHLKIITKSITSLPNYLFVPASEAICKYYQNFKQLGEMKPAVLAVYAKQIMDGLVSRLNKRVFGVDLCNGLRVMGFLVKFHKGLAAPNMEKIASFLIMNMIRSCGFPSVMTEINFLLARLAQANAFKNPPDNDRFIQYLLFWIHELKPEELENEVGVGFELLNSIFLHASIYQHSFVLDLFTSAASRITVNTDRDLSLDEGAGSLLTSIAVKTGSEFATFCETIIGRGSLLANQIPKLIAVLMSPDNEFPGHVLSKLVVGLLHPLPDLLRSNYETMLRNIVASCAKPTCEKVEANWVIFTFVCMNLPRETVNVLNNLPGPFGGSALHFILTLWRPMNYMKIGVIERKILVCCLTKFLTQVLMGGYDAVRKTLEGIVIEFKYAHNEYPTPKDLNGLEHLVYLTISCLLCENELLKRGERRIINVEQFEYEDLGDNPETVKSDEDLYLWRNHEFNVDVLSEISLFCNMPFNKEFYLTVVHYFFPMSIWDTLKDLRCPVPPPIPSDYMFVEETPE